MFDLSRCVKCLPAPSVYNKPYNKGREYNSPKVQPHVYHHTFSVCRNEKNGKYVPYMFVETQQNFLLRDVLEFIQTGHREYIHSRLCTMTKKELEILDGTIVFVVNNGTKDKEHKGDMITWCLKAESNSSGDFPHLLKRILDERVDTYVPGRKLEYRYIGPPIPPPPTCCLVSEDEEEPESEDEEDVPEYVDVKDPVSEDESESESEDEKEPESEDEEEPKYKVVYEEASQIYRSTVKREIVVDGVVYYVPYPWDLND